MQVEIECSRLHAWVRVVEDDFGQTSIQAGPSISCVPYFKACAASKSAATRTWGSTGTGVGYLHARQFACCLAFCPGVQCWGCWVLIDWDYGSDRGRWWNTCLAAQFAPEPSHLNICRWVQPEPGQRDMASGPSMLDFWWKFRSEPGRRDMASRPAKFDFGRIWSELGQCNMASRPATVDFWRIF